VEIKETGQSEVDHRRTLTK